MPVNSEIFRIYRHLFYGSPLKSIRSDKDIRKIYLGGFMGAVPSL